METLTVNHYFDAMSIFDDDKDQMERIDNTVYTRLTNERRVSVQFEFINEVWSSDDDCDYVDCCTYISKVDAFYRPSIPGIPYFSEIRQDVKVVFSKETPNYQRKYEDKPWFNGGNIAVLGEYNHNHDTHGECILLYIHNIKASCGSILIDHKTKQLLLATYVHELYHAYFKSEDGYKAEVEEPLAEFGTLFCLEVMACMGVVDLSEVDSYHSRVKDKKDALPIYAFGADIFEKHSQKQTLCEMGRILKAYKESIPLCNLSSWNPEDWDKAYEDLKKALNYVD